MRVLAISISMFLLCSVDKLLADQNFNHAQPNAKGQTPAFTGQTRAPILPEEPELAKQVVAAGLRHPWGMVELPDGAWLVTERPGRMRRITLDGEISKPIKGLPKVDAQGQGGLLDVAVMSDFTSTRRLWWSYAEPQSGGENTTAVATGVLSKDHRIINDVQVIFRQQPAWNSKLHFGSRLVFDRTGALFITTGERSHQKPRALAQNVRTHLGKVIRIDPMGGAARGNPKIPGGLPEIWSYGHRNIQGAALGPDNELWTVEHGPRGGDELNRPQPGRNYGWPTVTYGIEYSGAIVGKGITRRAGVEQPIYYWDPVIAPSGMAFYQGALFPSWKGDILIGGLRSQALIRLKLAEQKVIGEARYLQGQGRVRDVAVAQDGAVMILIDAFNGKMIRVVPARIK